MAYNAKKGYWLVNIWQFSHTSSVLETHWLSVWEEIWSPTAWKWCRVMMSLRGVAWDAYTHEWALDHDLDAMEDAGERGNYEKKEVEK